MSRGHAITVERVDGGILCTLDTGGLIFFDNTAFAVTIANAILRVALFEKPKRVHVDHACRTRILPDEDPAQLAARMPAEDFDERGTGEPPC